MTVRTCMLLGERTERKIAARIKQEYGAEVSHDAVRLDMQEIRSAHTDWEDSMAAGSAGLRAQKFDEYLIEDIAIMQDGIKSMSHAFERNAHKISWIIPQIISCMEQVTKLQEKSAIYEANRKLHERLKAREEAAAKIASPEAKGR